MGPAAVLWDMDGTLVDSEPLHEEALQESLRSLGIEPPPDFHLRTLGLAAPAVFALVRDDLGMPLSFEEWSLRVHLHYLNKAGGLRPRPGAIEIFRALEERGAPQAIVSNSDRMVVDANLRATALAAPGLRSVSRNDVRLGKPDPEPYLRAAYLLGVEPHRCAVVEDSRTGAASGLAAGMLTFFWPQIALDPPSGARAVGTAEELSRALLDGAP